jgi:hypothetical protein
MLLRDSIEISLSKPGGSRIVRPNRKMHAEAPWDAYNLGEWTSSLCTKSLNPRESRSSAARKKPFTTPARSSSKTATVTCCASAKTSKTELAVKEEGRHRAETGLLFCFCRYLPRLTPITFPLTMISTRRFSFRPAAVLLSAMGSASPSPLDVMASADNPCAIKNCRTVSARC